MPRCMLPKEANQDTNNIQYDSGDYIEPVAVLTNKKGKYSWRK